MSAGVRDVKVTLVALERRVQIRVANQFGLLVVFGH
jgi:hypothetical protein